MKNSEEYVYILNFSNRIKIGYTTRPIQNRINEIENTSGEKVQDFYYVSAPMIIERELHRTFKKYRTIGEYFEIPFQMAVDELKKLVVTPTTLHDTILGQTFKVCMYSSDYQYMNKVIKDIEDKGVLLPSHIGTKLRNGSIDFKTLAIFMEQIGFEIVFHKKENNFSDIDLSRHVYSIET